MSKDTPDTQADTANVAKMLWIGCKLPNGLLCEMGSRDDDNYVAHQLKGANDARIIGGYGLTRVPEDFWNAWVKKHARLSFVKQGLVFAEKDHDSARDHAEERAAVKTGLEPLDPIKKVTDPATGEVILEADTGHLAQGRKDLARMGMLPQRGGR